MVSTFVSKLPAGKVDEKRGKEKAGYNTRSFRVVDDGKGIRVSP